MLCRGVPSASTGLCPAEHPGSCRGAPDLRRPRSPAAAGSPRRPRALWAVTGVRCGRGGPPRPAQWQRVAGPRGRAGGLRGCSLPRAARRTAAREGLWLSPGSFSPSLPRHSGPPGPRRCRSRRCHPAPAEEVLKAPGVGQPPAPRLLARPLAVPRARSICLCWRRSRPELVWQQRQSSCQMFSWKPSVLPLPLFLLLLVVYS